MIAWKYIDKAAASVAAMQDYDSMRAIINNTPDEIKAVYTKMTSPRKANHSGAPSSRNPCAGAEKLAEQIDRLDILRERYGNAVEYMAWFEAAWGTLDDTEQHILREFYMSDNLRSGATSRLSEDLNFTERHVDRLRSKALRRLQLLLYG